MNIGVDARVLEKNITGIGRILDGVIRGMPYLDPSVRFTLFTNSPITVTSNNVQCVSTGTLTAFPKLVAPLWLNGVLPGYLDRHSIDLFFAPNFFLPSSLKKKKIKSVVVIHDVIHRVFPHFQPLLYRMYLDHAVKHAVMNSDTIVADSESSRRDIIRCYHIKPEKVHVVYPFARDVFVDRPITDPHVEQVRHKYRLPTSFILFVGVIEKRKNIEMLKAVHAKLRERHIEIPMVLVGRRGYGSEDLLYDINNKPGIRYIDFVEDQDLPMIYNLATVFLFPSWYEGFGFPPLEAMQSGVPTVASNAGSLPEVMGEGIPCYDPSDINGFVDQIERLVSDEIYYQTMKNAGVQRAKVFNRDNSLSALYRIFTEVVQGR